MHSNSPAEPIAALFDQNSKPCHGQSALKHLITQALNLGFDLQAFFAMQHTHKLEDPFERDLPSLLNPFCIPSCSDKNLSEREHPKIDEMVKTAESLNEYSNLDLLFCFKPATID